MVDQNQSKYLIFGIGNPLLDLSVECPTDEMIKRYEMIAGQAILAGEKQMPIYKELWGTDGIDKIPGGSALNTIRAAAWMLKKTHAEKVCCYQGSIGKDEVAEVLKSETEKSGLHGNFSQTEEHATGTCAVVVHEKERAMCANLSAALKFPLSHLEASMQDLHDAKVLYSTCFFITANTDALLHVGKYACESNKPMGLNLSAVFLMQFELANVLAALEYADYVFCNEDEADAFAKATNMPEGSTRQDVAKAIAKSAKKNDKRPRNAIVTQGGEPVILATSVLGSDEVTLREIAVPALTKDQLIDTNGAGDSFVGGFLAQLAQDKDIDTCIKCGTYLSSQVIQRSGCTFPAENTFEC
jgi:adenosine kinase